MNEFTTAILLAALLSVPAQDPTLEDKAVIRVQQTPASRYDPTLPGRPFGNWLNQVVGPQSGVSWRLGECVEQDGAASEWEQDIPACVEATAILPDDRKIVAQILVGSFKQGLSTTTKFHFAVIEEDNQFLSVPKLSDLPQLLKEPFSPVRSAVKSAVRSDESRGLKAATLPQIKLNGAPQLYYAKAPTILALPQIAPAEVEDAPPPPKPAPPIRVSKGVLTGEAVTRVQPVYPPIARQVNASGEVIVQITINEY